MLQDLVSISAALDLSAAAAAAAGRLQRRIDAAVAEAERNTLGRPASELPNVLFCVFTDPFFCGGYWTPQLIEMAGGRHPLNPSRHATDSWHSCRSRRCQASASMSLQVHSSLRCGWHACAERALAPRRPSWSPRRLSSSPTLTLSSWRHVGTAWRRPSGSCPRWSTSRGGSR